jgi:signal transduction histidine kinase
MLVSGCTPAIHVAICVLLTGRQEAHLTQRATRDGDDHGYSINPLKLRFSSLSVEGEFQVSWLRATQQMRVVWSTAGSIVYATYSSLIYYASGIEFWELHWFRFLIVIPIFLLVSVLVLRGRTTPPVFAVVFPLVNTFAFANASYCYATVTGEGSLLFLYEMAALFVCGLLYFPALFRPIAVFLVVGTIISFFTFWYVWLNAGQGWVAISVQSSLLMALTISGLAAAYAKDLLIRRNFRARKVERENLESAERLARAAHAASEAKSRFVAMVGHEFRTPLNAIMGYSEILHMRPGKSSTPEKTAEFMGDILRSAQQLHRLVENVLAISNGPDEPLQANIDVVELNSITSRVAGINLIRADRRKIQLTQSYGADRIDVAADHWMVAHMLEELISNALKFTEPGGRVDIEVMPRTDGGGEIRVSDNGRGISADMKERVFEPFTQTQSDLNRTYEGLGLGLALVSNMASAQDARIRLSSIEGAGTSMLIVFRPPGTQS